MKKQNLIMCLVVIILAVSGIFAQDGKMDMKKMDMEAMMKSPHHTVMMAYQRNALSFAHVLWELSADGKIEDVDLARNAFAELKRSMEKMDEVHKLHMSKMDAAMMEQMKPMMEKMDAEKAAVMVHIIALEKALQANSPNAQEIEMHSAALVMQFEKMKMPDKPMKM